MELGNRIVVAATLSKVFMDSNQRYKICIDYSGLSIVVWSQRTDSVPEVELWLSAILDLVGQTKSKMADRHISTSGTKPVL